jgi:hypothetical protein
VLQGLSTPRQFNLILYYIIFFSFTLILSLFFFPFIIFYSQVELQKILEDEELDYGETTFYKLSKKCWSAAKEVFEDSQAALLSELLALTDPIVISFDMGWHKRYGHNSDLGRFCVYVFNLGKLIYGGVKDRGREQESNGVVNNVAKGNYDGSSKGMEQSALEDFLTWAANNGLLPKISVACCDKDSSTHKLLEEDSRCRHIEKVYDPGHVKKSFQGSLIKIFGKKKATETFAPRMASWMMRSLSEAKSTAGSDRIVLQKEFVRLMNYMIPHYTCDKCPPDCPCYGIPFFSIRDSDRDATVCSPLDSEKDVIFYSILRHLDMKSLVTMSLYVCHHWNSIAQNVIALLERRKNKFILPSESPEVSEVKTLVSKMLSDSSMICHQWHTCIVESSHNQCLSFGDKRVHFYSSFEGRTFSSYAKFNLGWNWISKLYAKLGIPVGATLASYLKKKGKKSLFHRERQQSIEYKARQRVLSAKKNKEKLERNKKSKKRGHDYAEFKELYPNERKKKKQKTAHFEMEDRVFGKLGRTYYFGVVLSVDMDIEEGVMVRFIDDDVHDMKPEELVHVDDMNEDAKCWVPKWIRSSCVSFETFEEDYYSKFDRSLEKDLENYLEGFLYEDDSP